MPEWNEYADKYKPIPRGAAGGWEKIGARPVLGGALGTVFDCAVLKEDKLYKMWFSWRPAKLIAYTTSADGIDWELPRVALTAVKGSDWEGHEVSRPSVLKKDGLYHMWYNGHLFPGGMANLSAIGYATSRDGIHWRRACDAPVLKPELEWEKTVVWCPHVLWEESEKRYKMWYSGGGVVEADAIGYAVSPDGIHWEKDGRNPVFTPDKSLFWEMQKVSACFVFKRDGWYNMFYMGNDADIQAAAGLARSRDGITNWQRHPDNPILAGSEGLWDFAGICRATVLEEEDGYRLWYNGCNRKLEEIGLAVHKGFDLGFPPEGTFREPERGVWPYKAVMNPME